MKYNYGNLSDIEFEELCRDVISIKEGIYFESFKKGKDQGIDLIYSKSNDKGGEKIIVQCKHYFKSKFSDLKSTLFSDKKNKTSELSKLKLLTKTHNLERYILICSLELSYNEKIEILNGFGGFIKTTGDILGINDIEGLIDKEVEKRNFKLWLNSYTILESFLEDGFRNIKNHINKGILNRSSFTREDILKETRKFVAIPKINEAIDSLQKNNVVIISGDPGIGKTTLAKVLLLPYFDTNKGYEFIEISKDIDEGFDLFDSNKKQIFYYDDFLGRSAYRGENKNEAKRINQFIKKILISDNKKLIFTTREYILREAEEKEDEFNLEGIIGNNKIIVNINDYGLIIKGKILYNHIYFSDLNSNYTSQIFTNLVYLKIIQHKNYSPRLIEQFTKKEIINNDAIEFEKYIDFVINILDYPEKIWKLGFENINKYTQNILILLKLYEYGAEQDLLYEDLCILLNESIDNFVYRKSLKIVDDSFISVTKKEVYRLNQRKFIKDKEFKVYYKNPGIGDYILKEVILKDKKLLMRLINLFIKKPELLDFLNRYFKDNETIKKYFTEKYLNLIQNEDNFELKLNLYIKLIKENKNIVYNLENVKNDFKGFIDEFIFINYDSIKDKCLFLEIFDIFFYSSDFKFFNYIEDDIENLDKDKLDDFKDKLEQDIYFSDSYKDKDIFEKLCFFVNNNNLKFLYGDDMIENYIQDNSLVYNNSDTLEDIEGKINELDSLNSYYIGEMFNSEINSYITNLEKEKENRQRIKENILEDYEPEISSCIGNNELDYIHDLFNR